MPQTLEQSVDIAAPAGRVWDLVSTSEGLSGWFVDATVAPGPQGSVTLRFAPGAEGTVPVLAWDPPRRIRFGMADGGRVHDITVVAAAGGCQVRLQDEGVPDAEAEATAAGWAGFLGRLRTLAEAGRLSARPQAGRDDAHNPCACRLCTDGRCQVLLEALATAGFWPRQPGSSCFKLLGGSHV